MSRSDYIKFSNEVKAKLSDIIIGFNFIEISLKEILCAYIKSTRSDFVNDILLHNSILSFSTKLSILKYILVKEGIPFKDHQKFYKLMHIRNAVAHSDNLINYEGDIIGEEVMDDEYDIRIPIYAPYVNGPKITVVKEGKVNEKGLFKMYEEFNENKHDLENILSEIKLKLEML